MSAGAWPTSVLALAGVVALILLLRRVLAAFPKLLAAGAATAGGAMALEQVIPIGPRRRLLLVRVGARRVVLLSGAAQDVVVGWVDAEPTP